jgi:hypothetical protein
MSDNVPVTPGTGADIATDDVGGIHFQRMKLVESTADSSTPTGVAANPLQVSLANTAANATAVKVDGSAVTQPVSATNLDIRDLSSASDSVTAALAAGSNNIGDVDVLTVPAPLSTAGGGTEATALRVTVASDSTGVLSVDDNGSSLTVDAVNLDIRDLTSVSDSITPVTLDQTQNAALTTGTLTDTFVIGDGIAAVSLRVSGTWVGTIAFEGTLDNVIWDPVYGCRAGVGTLHTSIDESLTANIFRFTMAGIRRIRATFTRTSGTANITWVGSKGTAGVYLNFPIPPGANSIGLLGANSGVDIGDVTINNASGGSAVNIQDGGNVITVDGTVAANCTLAAETTKVIGTVNIAAAQSVGIAAGSNNIGDVDILSIAAGDNNIGNVDIASIAAGDNNIGNVDVATVPADPFGANADAGSATGSISAKLRYLAGTGIAGMTALPAGSANIGDVDVLSVPAPLSSTGGGTEAAALRVTIANDSTGVLSIDDNNSAITVDNGGTFAVQAACSQATASSLNAEVQGDVAHSAGVSGNPVLICGVSQNMDDTAPPNRVDAEADATRLATDWDGAIFAHPHGPQIWSYHLDTSSAQTDAQVHAATGSASLCLYVTDIVFSSGAATAINLFFEEGASKVLGPYYLEAIAGRGMALHFITPKKLSANTALTLTTSAAIAHSVDVTGFVGVV